MSKYTDNTKDMSSFHGEQAPPPYPAETMPKNAYNEGHTAPFPSGQQTSIGFVVPPEQPSSAPYMDQNPYNPSYNPTIHHTTTVNSSNQYPGNNPDGGYAWVTHSQGYFTNIRTLKYYTFGIVAGFILITIILIVVYISI